MSNHRVTPIDSPAPGRRACPIPLPTPDFVVLPFGFRTTTARAFVTPAIATDYRLRPAESADYTRLAAWIPDAKACARWAGPLLPFPFAPTELPALLTGHAASNHSLVDPSGVVVAFGQLVVKTSGLVHLARIIVAPERRGVGVGRRLCEHLIAEAARQPGIETLSLGVYRDNRAAIALYLSLGFIETPPHPRPEIYAMTRAVPQAGHFIPPRLTLP